MAIRVPPLSVDDEEYYPLHEEDDVPETPPHEAAVRYARDAVAARFPDWLVTGNTLEGERLRSHEESEQQLELTAQQLKTTEQRLVEEARRRQEAEQHAAELERQLAALRAQQAEPDGST
jgi:DNA repair exonuclease SbcCD ATPase subunit